ncbi:MAG: hypothetical protein IJU51_08240 [Clostridia bacterium]|nr:hypothetical protein [Clostridia bacterium]
MNNELKKHAMNDSELDNVSGGLKYVFDASSIEGSTPGRPFEVLDANGNNIYEGNFKLSYPTKNEALAVAQALAGLDADKSVVDLGDNWNYVDKVLRKH